MCETTRAERIRQITQAIRDGLYESDRKLAVSIERIIDAFREVEDEDGERWDGQS